MLRRPVSLGFLIWVIVGVVVAANKGYFDALDTVSGVVSAVLAVLLWPLVLLGVHAGI